MRIPPTLVLIFSIIALFGMLTWIVPAGEFKRMEKDGRTVVVPGTYTQVAPQPQGIDKVLAAPIKGFVLAAYVIALVFVAGAAFGVVNATGAISSGIQVLAVAVEKSPVLQKAMIPILMSLFSLAGATFGMSEEVLAFILIFIPFSRALGYDSIVGVAIPFVGAGTGFAAAFLNPFTVGVAQGIADLPLFSGIEFRLVMWVVFTTISILFVGRYAKKIKKNPALSPVYALDGERLESSEGVLVGNLSARQKIVLGVLAATLVALVVGALKFDWYITEIGALFLGMAILTGLVGRLKMKEFSDSFVSGAKDMLTAALVVACSRGILVIASEGKIIDTVLDSMTGLVRQAHPIISAYAMLVVQFTLHFLVPSGSGQAALSMPIMTPLSDLLGVTRQTAVLIFQYGDG
ncbi:MAG: YfcC family protein, partial [Ignavibacteriales bacterium]|nr:YfcC family protein [Ignavibacteriales bacterium]